MLLHVRSAKRRTTDSALFPSTDTPNELTNSKEETQVPSYRLVFTTFQFVFSRRCETRLGTGSLTPMSLPRYSAFRQLISMRYITSRKSFSYDGSTLQAADKTNTNAARYDTT